MEKNILKQYDSVLKEIVETDRRIRETQAKIERMEKAGTVTDSVSGGYGGIQHFKIEGLPTTEYNRQKSLLLARKLKLENLRKKLESATCKRRHEWFESTAARIFYIPPGQFSANFFAWRTGKWPRLWRKNQISREKGRGMFFQNLL